MTVINYGVVYPDHLRRRLIYALMILVLWNSASKRRPLYESGDDCTYPQIRHYGPGET
jgi:hypothetical protein